ncbi:UDP-glucose 4-epimerase GalE [Candidatus Saccharibacteria bacterium]|nr:UDP-glucose 4-epimerase GalE [Candidatus Saccharibacteria bacterium]MBR2710795.1 UDP-glucose 4-epimerase GalE [Candidatus Saccharibacteria bacterium]
MRILVTGGTGYIGSHTVVELINAGYEVEILDNLFNSKMEVLDVIKELTDTKPVFHQVDLLDADKMNEVFAAGNFDAVVHFAGLKAVGESVEQPLRYYENNVVGTVNLLKAMRAHGVSKIVFSSSATVYGDPGVVSYTEDLPTGQNIPSPYGKTKYMIEEILKDICAADAEFSAVLLRYFNPVGAHASGLLGENPNGRPNNLMPIVMKVATGEIAELSVYGNDYDTPDGTCIRDYIHVVDLARGHLLALSHIQPGIAIYNLGSGKGTSVLEMVAAFEKARGQKLPFKFAPRRAGDLAEFYANPTKAEAELGFKTELTIDDAMKDTLRYLENHPRSAE